MRRTANVRVGKLAGFFGQIPNVKFFTLAPYGKVTSILKTWDVA